MKIGVFYGSSTGNTAQAAQAIAAAMGVGESDIHDVAKSKPSDVAPYDVLILGSSTWGAGDLQDDWYDFLDGLEALDLSKKIIALFGCGDENMSDTFCGAVGTIYDRLQPTGASFIGAFPADCYDYSETPAEKGGLIVGLLLDDVNKPDLTPGRIEAWTTQLKGELAP